eukprot:gene21636-49072_t
MNVTIRPALALGGARWEPSHADALIEDFRDADVTAGVSLLSCRVMTLTHADHPGHEVELLLPPRSAYQPPSTGCTIDGGGGGGCWKDDVAAHRDS